MGVQMKRRKRVKATKRKPLRKVVKRRKRKPSPVRRKVPKRKGVAKPRKHVKRAAKKRTHRKKPANPRKKPTRAKRRKENLKRRVRRDKVRVFGTRRRRQPKEMPKAIVEPDIGQVAFEDQLIAEQEKPEGAFTWTNEDEFIAQMERLGFSEREAYTLWFS